MRLIFSTNFAMDQELEAPEFRLAGDFLVREIKGVACSTNWRVDDGRVISGIIHLLKTGGRWRDCPLDHGLYTTIYDRFNRWSK